MKKLTFAATLAFAAAFSITSSLGQSNIDGTNSFAYGANIGWENWRHDQPSAPNGILVGPTFLSGFSYSANCGWINFGDGTPANGTSYQNNSASDFGVNIDGSGNLSGFAYGANIGWINYGWAGGGDPDRPRVNLGTGEFTGFAYSANCGWINLGAGFLGLDPGSLDPDPDGDFIITFLEDAFDTDPNDKTSGREGLPTISRADDNSTATIQFRQLDAPAGRTYTVQQSVDANVWSTAAGVPSDAADQSGSTADTTLKELTVNLAGVPLLHLRVLVSQ